MNPSVNLWITLGEKWKTCYTMHRSRYGVECQDKRDVTRLSLSGILVANEIMT
jgi:hypothetical protein